MITSMHARENSISLVIVKSFLFCSRFGLSLARWRLCFFFFGEAHIGHRAVALVYQLCKWFFVVLMQNTLHFNRVLAAQLNLQECGDVILTAALQNPNITVLSMRNVNMGKR
jgi:hypothetical protein